MKQNVAKNRKHPTNRFRQWIDPPFFLIGLLLSSELALCTERWGWNSQGQQEASLDQGCAKKKEKKNKQKKQPVNKNKSWSRSNGLLFGTDKQKKSWLEIIWTLTCRPKHWIACAVLLLKPADFSRTWKDRMTVDLIRDLQQNFTFAQNVDTLDFALFSAQIPTAIVAHQRCIQENHILRTMYVLRKIFQGRGKKFHHMCTFIRGEKYCG